jgi:hypothetical protein
MLSPVLGQACAQVSDTTVPWNMPNSAGSRLGMPLAVAMWIVCYMSCALFVGIVGPRCPVDTAEVLHHNECYVYFHMECRMKLSSFSS